MLCTTLHTSAVWLLYRFPHILQSLKETNIKLIASYEISCIMIDKKVIDDFKESLQKSPHGFSEKEREKR